MLVNFVEVALKEVPVDKKKRKEEEVVEEKKRYTTGI